jgi:hypothetical protein
MSIVEVSPIESFSFSGYDVITLKWPGPAAPRKSVDFASRHPEVLVYGIARTVIGIDAPALAHGVPISTGSPVALSLLQEIP